LVWLLVVPRLVWLHVVTVQATFHVWFGYMLRQIKSRSMFLVTHASHFVTLEKERKKMIKRKRIK
jgi:hypothetical protein